MRKLKALLLALCFVAIILIANIPGVNYGHGPGYVYEQNYGGYDDHDYEDKHEDGYVEKDYD